MNFEQVKFDVLADMSLVTEAFYVEEAPIRGGFLFVMSGGGGLLCLAVEGEDVGLARRCFVGGAVLGELAVEDDLVAYGNLVVAFLPLAVAEPEHTVSLEVEGRIVVAHTVIANPEGAVAVLCSEESVVGNL